MSRLDRYLVPEITDRNYTITADIEPGQNAAEGALLAIGSWAAGCALYVQDGHAHYEYAYDSDTRWRVSSTVPIGDTTSRIRVRFERNGHGGGRATLVLDDENVGSIEIPATWPAAALAGGLYCGRDGGTPAGSSYELPFSYSGVLHRVTLEVDPNDPADSDDSAELSRALGEQ